MKICFFINGFGGGGAEKQCAFLINELKSKPGIYVSLIYFFEGINFHLIEDDEVVMQRIPSKSLYDIRNISIINNILRDIQPDILFSWMHAPDVYSFFSKLRHPNIKWIIAERNSRYNIRNFRFLLRAVLGRFSNHIICNSEEGRSYWKQNFVRDSKLSVVPNILYPASRSLIPAGMLQGTPAVLFAGRIEPQKNVLVLARAFCELAGRHRRAKFYIVGDGSQKAEVARIIEESGSHEQVVLLPFQQNIQAFFWEADLFVNISLYEGLPNSVIENVQLDKKMVVSGISQHRNVLGPAYPFYVDDYQDVARVAATIERAMEYGNFESEYDYAKNQLEGMMPKTVVDSYKKIFSDILK